MSAITEKTVAKANTAAKPTEYGRISVPKLIFPGIKRKKSKAKNETEALKK